MNNSTIAEDPNLTLAEAGKFLKVGPAAVRRLILNGELQAFSIGRQFRVPASRLARFIDSGCSGSKAHKRSEAGAVN